MAKILGHRRAAAAQPDAASASQSAAPAEQQPLPTAPPQDDAAQPTAPHQQAVDIAAVLTNMVTKNPQKLHWRHSIVDPMKLVGLDGGLEARRQLAQELGYGYDAGDSAAMNIWLHKRVMRKLAENGGKVPD